MEIPQLFPLQLNVSPHKEASRLEQQESILKKKKSGPQNVTCFLRPLVLFSVLMICVVGIVAADTLYISKLKGA